MSQQDDFRESVKGIYKAMLALFAMLVVIAGLAVYVIVDPSLSYFSSEDYVSTTEVEDDRIENGIHVGTGFVEGEGLTEVINNCTNCHSAKLVIQNRMTKEQWEASIRWMQETQNLWDLGNNEEIIVNYLATHYAPTKKGRRQNLTNIEWYELEE